MTVQILVALMGTLTVVAVYFWLVRRNDQPDSEKGR
jgi:hypothetical protein